MPKPRILETTTVADVEELLSSHGPDAVVVRDMVDPQPFSDLRAGGSPDGSIRYDRLLQDQVPTLGAVVTAAEVWIAQRMPGLKVEPGGFYHDQAITKRSRAHVDVPRANLPAGTIHNLFKGPMTLSLGVQGDAGAIFYVKKVPTYAVRQDCDGLYRLRRIPLEAKCSLRTWAANTVMDNLDTATVRQFPGDGVFIAGLPWQTYHRVGVPQGRRSELFDMYIGNDPKYWDKK